MNNSSSTALYFGHPITLKQVRNMNNSSSTALYFGHPISLKHVWKISILSSNKKSKR